MGISSGESVAEMVATRSLTLAFWACVLVAYGTGEVLNDVDAIGAEDMLKKEGVSLAALKKMSKKELLKRIKIRRRQVATCRVQVATLHGQLLEGKRCMAKMEHIKSKFKGVASYLKANANKWKKKDVLEKLKGKKEGAQARAMARGLSRAES